MRVRYVVIGVVVGILLSSAVVVLAGNLDPPSEPTDAASQMFTLEQIYDRLNDGTGGSEMTSFTEPAGGPGAGTMHSLDEIMAIAPAADNTRGASGVEVLAGRTYWGLRTDGAWGLQTGMAPPAPVPRTGVTATFAISDDGALQMGVAWPEPRFTIHDNGTADLADDTVTDNLTGLIWTRNAGLVQLEWYDSSGPLVESGGSTAPGDTGGWQSPDYTEYPALSYCKDLELGPYDDWRLPNVRELHTLVHYGFTNLALPDTAGPGQWTMDGDPFINAQSDDYWSSTTYATDLGSAWFVVLGDGVVNFERKDTNKWVWPVRGGQ